jgi:hypothetical protein
MSEWKCIAYLPDGSLCNLPATIIDPVRRGMICARCAEADILLEADSATHAFNNAKRLVEASPLLREYAGLLLDDWTRPDTYWEWISKTPEEQVARWARLVMIAHNRAFALQESQMRELRAAIKGLEQKVAEQDCLIRHLSEQPAPFSIE